MYIQYERRNQRGLVGWGEGRKPEDIGGTYSVYNECLSESAPRVTEP